MVRVIVEYNLSVKIIQRDSGGLYEYRNDPLFFVCLQTLISIDPINFNKVKTVFKLFLWSLRFSSVLDLTK